MNVKYVFIVSIVWFSPTNKNLFGIRHVLLFILVFFAFSEEGDAKSLQSHWKNPHFEYAFSYFQQMVRDAVDGRTINVVLLSLKLLFLEIFKFFTLCALWHNSLQSWYVVGIKQKPLFFWYLNWSYGNICELIFKDHWKKLNAVRNPYFPCIYINI